MVNRWRLIRDKIHMNRYIPVVTVHAKDERNFVRVAINHTLIMNGDVFAAMRFQQFWQKSLKHLKFPLPFGLR